MDQSLFSSKEIELLLASARSRQPVVSMPGAAPKTEPFDFRGASYLSSAQATRILELHAEFASKLSRALSQVLGLECIAKPAGVEQLPYADLTGKLPEGALFGALQIPAVEGVVLLHAELATVLPMIDLILGGAGSAPEAVRPLTEIDREIFRPVVELFSAEMQSAWAPVLEASARYEYYGAAANLFPSAERVLGIKIEMQIGELRGAWTLILPSLVSNAFTREVEQQISVVESDKSERNQRLLRERVMDSRFRVELYLPSSKIPVRSLAHLKAGNVVILKPRATDPIHLNIAGIHLFQATPVSCGTRRGAQIKKALSILDGAKKETR